MTEVCVEALTSEGWVLEIIDVRDIYGPDGTPLIDWDGILFGTHSDFEPTFFFLNKEVFTLHDYYDLMDGVARMFGDILPAISYHVTSSSDDIRYISFADEIKKHLRQNYQAVGVLSSRGTSASTLETVLSENKVVVVYPSHEQNKSHVHGLTPKSHRQQHDQNRQ